MNLRKDHYRFKIGASRAPPAVGTTRGKTFPRPSRAASLWPTESAIAWASLRLFRMLRNRQSFEPSGCNKSPEVSAAGTAVKFHEDGA